MSKVSFPIHGIKHMVFKNTGNESASIYVGRALRDFENDNMAIRATGFFDSIEEFEKTRVRHLNICPIYASKLIESGAFVPYKQYEIVTEPMPDNPLQSWVTSIVPVDPQIKKTFEDVFKQTAEVAKA